VHLPDEVPNLPPDPRYDPYRGKSILDIPLGVDTFRNAGSMLGTCCAMVMSDAVDPVLALHNVMRFYRHESCGQCTPCREGTGWLEKVSRRVADGTGKPGDLELLGTIAHGIAGNSICALGDAAAWPTMGFLTKYWPEFEAKIRRAA